MSSHSSDALAIWQAGVQAVLPEELIVRFMAESTELREALAGAKRILVVGAGKAGGAMAAALESALAGDLDRLEGIVNVPANAVRLLKKIRLQAARPAGSNHPTTAGVVGGE
jgi:glycerate 2-kinase